MVASLGLIIRGVAFYPGFLSPSDQAGLVAAVKKVVQAAPLFCPVTARGKQMSVRMTSAGNVGWVSDRQGYRYQARHPDGYAWPPLPEALLGIWSEVAPDARAPDSCLINFYGRDARMGMHQDRDEADLTQPVVSISLGDDALFRIGNLTRGGKTDTVWLRSGDIVVIGGAARLVYHGIDRIRSGSSSLLSQGGRLNLTLRVAL